MSFSHNVSDLVSASESALHAAAPWWIRVPLGEVCEIRNGYPFKSDFFNETRGVPLLRIRDVTSGDVGTRYAGDIPEGYWVEPNDIVVGMDGDFNSRMWSSEKALLNQRVCKLAPNERYLDKKFLNYILPAYLQLINDHTHSITVKHLSSRTISEIPVPLPPRPEQGRIVSKLDSLFERSRRTRKELGRIPLLIERYKQAILSAAFRGELTADVRRNGDLGEPVSPRKPHEMKPKYRSESGRFSPPYELPNGWRWLRLPELGDLDRGKSKHRPRNDPTLYGGVVPFIQTGEVRQAGRVLTAFSKTYSEAGVAQSRVWYAGTVCITIAANIAETTILGIDACFPDSVVGFVPDETRVSNSYIEYFLRTVKADLADFAPATAQKNINLDTLSGLFVPVAPGLEQDEIVRRIETSEASFETVLEESTKSLELLDHLDQAHLSKAFRGELVPQDPKDAPTAILLERIRQEREAQTPAGRTRRVSPGRRRAAS